MTVKIKTNDIKNYPISAITCCTIIAFSWLATVRERWKDMKDITHELANIPVE